MNKKKIAIVGAGLAGVGTAYFLLKEGAAVTLFDAEGVGAGASGVCSGLLHPYPGLSARCGKEAMEGLELTQQLIALAEEEVNSPLACRKGILRRSIHEEQKERLKSYEDVQQVENDLFWIKKGWTVYSLEYLQALVRLLQRRGMQFIIKKIEDITQLKEFDRVLFTCGYGIREFFSLPVEFLKGQLLSYKGNSPFPMSFIAKGYITKTKEGFEVGATYERNFSTVLPCLEKAKELLPIQKEIVEGTLLGAKAAVRVCLKGHYLPLIQKISQEVFVFTGLGSRGLLYHALFGKKMAQMLLNS